MLKDRTRNGTSGMRRRVNGKTKTSVKKREERME